MSGEGTWWNHATLVAFGRYCGLSTKDAAVHIEEVCAAVESTLPAIDTARKQYAHLDEIGERVRLLRKQALEEIRAEPAMPKPKLSYAKRRRKKMKTIGATSRWP